MRGFVLDCHPDPVSNEMVLWLKDLETGEVLAHRERFAGSFYVDSRTGPALLERAEQVLSQFPQVDLARVQRRRGLEAPLTEVLQARVGTLGTFRHIAYTIDRLGEHRDLDLFDVDLRLSHQFLLSKQLFPFAHVRYEHGQVRLDDEQWALDYTPPALEQAWLSATPSTPAGRVATHEDPLEQATFRMDGQAHVLQGDEATILAELDALLDRLDPDVLFTEDGDRFLIRYLHHRANEAGFTLTLGRARDPPAPLRSERSFFTYGKISYQPRVEVLHGRIHIDTSTSFFHQEAGFWGLLDLSRITSTPIQELARVGAGTAVTAIQIDRAKREDRLVPWKKNRVEDPKTELDLVRSDRGGFIFDPQVGLFDDVVELDFASMYPNIMVSRNVSPETVLCACCQPGEPGVQRVPQIGTHTCKRPGFIGRALAPLIERREVYKRWRHEHPEHRERYQGAVDAIKWLAVCSFGYQGYKNARFGRIECHEAITAWGREILLSCGEIAREEGFEIIHGIVDSLWLQRVEAWADPERLARRASQELDIPLEIEGTYDWIVFLPTRASHAVTGSTSSDVSAFGALNRFYGCFSRPPDAPSRSNAGQEVDYLDRGRLKVRGVELRQHSAPKIVVRAQEAALLQLARATDGPGFRERIPDALDAVEEILEELDAGRVEPSELVITKRVSRALDDYRVRTDTWAALTQLDDAGIQVAPGDYVRFVVTDDESREPSKRLVEARLMGKQPVDYDRAFYREQIFYALESLLLPFGWDAGKLEQRFDGRREPTLWAFG